VKGGENDEAHAGQQSEAEGLKPALRLP
jgi:hypothetical protein